MKRAVFTVHMGYTDVINCLAFIDFYREEYDEVIIVSTPIHKNHIDFYIRNKKGVSSVYGNNTVDLVSRIAASEGMDNLSIGFDDITRTDRYRDSFRSAFYNTRKDEHFVKLFYDLYDIPYSVKVDYFNLDRDRSLEDKTYKDFINLIQYDDYVIYHSSQEDNIKDTMKRYDNCSYVNVNGKIENVFSFIKVLEKAKELHLVDSVWAATTYLLDAKYSIFKDKKIYLYPYRNRSGGLVKDISIESLQSPVNLPNWKIMK